MVNTKDRRLREIDAGFGAVRAAASISTAIASPSGGQSTNALTVNGFPAYATPTPNALLALGSDAKFPAAAMPNVLAVGAGFAFESAAAGDTVLRSKVTGDTGHGRWSIEAGGKHWWGAGGAGVFDTYLERSGSAALTTNAAVTAASVNGITGLASSATTQAIGDAAVTGTGTAVARQDHKHGLPNWGSPVTQAVGDAAADGSAATLARSDHRHGMPAFATPAVVLGTAASAGSAATLLRSDATVVAFDATAPTTITPDAAAAAGSVALAARRDHTHGIVAAAPGANSVSLAASAEGIGSSFARADHTHSLDQAIGPTWSGEHRFAASLYGHGGGTDYWQLTPAGLLTWGGDTNLYRGGAGLIKTDHALTVTGALDVLGSSPLRLGGDWQISRTAANLGTLGANDALASPNFVSGFEGTGWQIDGNGRAEFQSAYIRGTLYATTFTYKEVSALNGYFMVTNVAPLSDTITSTQNVIEVEAPVFRGNAAEGYSYLHLQTLDDIPASAPRTTLSGLHNVGETQISVANATGFAIGMRVIFADQGPWYTITGLHAGGFHIASPGLLFVQASGNTATGHTGSLSVKEEWMRVTSYDGQFTNSEGKASYRYSVTRGWNSTTPADWSKKTAVVEFGRALGTLPNKGGWLTLVGGSTDVEGPYLRVSHRYGDNATDYRVRVHVGQMYGILGETRNERFGLAVGDDLGAGSPGSSAVFLAYDDSNGLRLQNAGLKLYNGSLQTIDFTPAGTVKWGSNIAAPATTGLVFAGAAQTYNSESLAAGALLLGDNSSGKPNFLWTGSYLALRAGTTEKITLSSSGDASLSGVLGIGASGGIYQGSGTFASPTTGIKLWNVSGVGRLAGYNGGTLQWEGATDGKFKAGGGNVVLDSAGATVSSSGVEKIQLYSGYIKLGSDLSATATTSLIHLNVAATWNGESLPAGSLLLGNNSSGKPNVLWDGTDLALRSGTTDKITFDGSGGANFTGAVGIASGGSLTAGGGNVILDVDGALLRPRHRVDDPVLPTWSTVRWRHASASFDAAAIGAQMGSTSQPELDLTAYKNDGSIGAAVYIDATGQVDLAGASTVRVGAGTSASAPHIGTPGDPNTGIYFPSADTIAFAVGGAEGASINSGKLFSLKGLAAEAIGVVSNYTVADNDYFLHISATAASRTVTLPAASAKGGRILVIRKKAGAFNANVAAAGSDTLVVAGVSGSSYTLATDEALMLISDGTSAWYRIAAG